MHLRAFGQVVILAVLADQEIESARVFHRVAHDRGVHHAHAIVADANRAGLTHVRHFRELGAPLTFGDGAKGEKPGSSVLFRPCDHHLRDRARVV